MFEIISWLFVYVILPAAIAFGISLLLAPKPEKPNIGEQKIQLPTATEGRPFPVLFGCRMIRGINAITPILYKYILYNTYHDETAANLYFVTFAVGVCNCLDGIPQLWWGDRCAYPIANNPDSYASDSEILMIVQAFYLWGDWAYGGPGGVDCQIDICYGEDDQTLNSYLSSKLGSDQPYNRGFVSLVIRGPTTWMDKGNAEGGYIGTAPIIRPIAVLGKRTDQFCDHTTMWYPSKAAIGTFNDMNPAHIVYELMTSGLVGRGMDTSIIGDTFTDVADTLYDEDFGLSCVWDYAPDDIESMVQTIEVIVDGKIYFDYDSEQFEFGLNRNDYTPANLETFDESDFWVESASYLSPSRIPSKVIVNWEHRQYEGKRLAYDDDIALLAKQGGQTNVEEYDYSAFVVDGDLANKIAARQQYVFSAMPKKFTLRCLRTMSQLHETDVFKISYPALNIGSMIVRLVTIDRGSLTNGEVIIECMEDVFGMAYTIYGTPPAPATDPAETQSNITGDNVFMTEDVTVNIAYGLNLDDDTNVTDYSNLTIS